MKKIVLSLIIYMFCFISTITEVQIKEIWKKTMTEDVGVLLGEKEVTVKIAKEEGWNNLEGKQDNEKVKIPYIIATIGKDWKFYDTNGMEKKSIPKPTEGIEVSMNNEYIMGFTGPYIDNSEIDKGVLYRVDGTKLWEKKGQPIPYAVSNQGYVIAGHMHDETTPGDFVLYDPNGIEIANYKNPFKSGNYMVKFTEEGEYFVIGFHNVKQSNLILVSKNGNIIWNKKYEYELFRTETDEFAVKDVGIVGICEKNDGGHVYAYYIDWDGNLKWVYEINQGGNKYVDISGDNNKFFISTTSGYLYCFNINDGQLLWLHKETWSPKGFELKWDVPWFEDIIVVGDYVYIIGRYTKGGMEWYKSKLFIFQSSNGNLVYSEEFANTKANLFRYKGKSFLYSNLTKSIKCLNIENK